MGLYRKAAYPRIIGKVYGQRRGLAFRQALVLEGVADSVRVRNALLQGFFDAPVEFLGAVGVEELEQHAHRIAKIVSTLSHELEEVATSGCTMAQPVDAPMFSRRSLPAFEFFDVPWILDLGSLVKGARVNGHYIVTVEDLHLLEIR